MDPLALLLQQRPAEPSPTATVTGAPSASPSATRSPSTTASPTATATATGSPSASPSATSTASPSATRSPSATGSPSASASPTATGTPAPTGTAAPTGTGRLAVVNGTLDWSVKESFRSYLAKPMTGGKVEFGGGASDYRFGGATGSYDTVNHAVAVGFSGSVRFLGHPEAGGGYQLDTTLSKLGLAVDRDGAYLTADVRAKSRDGKPDVALTAARIAKLDLSRANPAPVGGVVALSGVPATLTAEGCPSSAATRPVRRSTRSPSRWPSTGPPSCRPPRRAAPRPVPAPGPPPSPVPAWSPEPR
ncbi:HtaA domain-containing protein [Kitasatospora aburaviensis]